MPRDSAGNYSLVAGNPVQSGEVVSSSWANNTLDDVAVALSDSLDRNGRGGMLAPFRFSDGTNLLPGAAWVNETTTGFYRFDGGDLRIAVLTQDVMRWQTSGVQIWNNTDLIWQNVLTDGGGGSQVPVNVGTADGQTLRWEADSSEWQASSALVVDDAGNVGIGAATPVAPLQIGEAYALGWSPFASTSTIFNGSPTANNTSLSLVASSLGTASILLGNELTQSLGVIEYDTPNNEVRVGATAAGGDVAIIAGSSVEHMRITSTGNVGIGTTAPTGKITLLGSSTEAGGIIFRSVSDGFNGGIQSVIYGGNIGAGYGDLRFATYQGGSGGGERMRIDSAGNVGIGTATPNGKLAVSNGTTSSPTVSGSADDLVLDTSANTGMTFGIGATGSGSIFFAADGGTADGYMQYSATDDSMRFATANTERMRIDASGNLLVGTTVSTNADDGNMIVGGVYISKRSAASELTRMSFWGAGLLAGRIASSSTATQYITTSDARLKKNIKDAGDPFAKLSAIQVREFDWKSDDKHQDFGFIAQELVEVAPEAVSKGETEEDVWGVDPSKLVPVLVKAIQELTARLEALEP